MHEGLYQPLPDIDAYLERIGIAAPRTPSTDFLDELIFAHQCHVPFENLEVNEGRRAPSLAKADLFDKIVTRKRGGYCFELNGLFYSLLKGLGFDVRASMARVLLRPTPYPMISHRANIVAIDGREYLVDVGFGGPMAPFAPLVEEGATRTDRGQTYTLRRHDANWWNIGFTGSSGEERDVLRFCALPSEEHDFVVYSYFQSANPQSVFRQRRQANLRTDDGAHDLMNMTYTHFQADGKTVVELQGEDELDQVLAQVFGITDWRIDPDGEQLG